MLKARGRALSCKVLFYHSIIIIFSRTRSTAFYFIATSSAVAFSWLFSRPVRLQLNCCSSMLWYFLFSSLSRSLLTFLVSPEALEFLCVSTGQCHRLRMDKTVGPAAGKMGFRFSKFVLQHILARGNAPG